MAASTTPRSTGLSSTTISPALLFSTIKGDAVGRLKRVFLRTENCVILVLSLIPVASAQENTVLFTPVPTADAMTIADVDAESGQLYMSAWDRRGELIRSGLTARECVGNLSVALHALGSLNAAEYNGAAGALSLLPTAGALIGSPTRELWVVFKLMPLAGVLSMCLSLGGTMVPSTAGEYNPNTAFSYGGMIATTELAEKRIGQDLEEGGLEKLSTAERFANRVARRADEVCGGGLYGRVWLGVAIQVVLVATIMIALWYGQLGGIITWWCQVWGWMYFWFSLVIITSLIDNIASVPFTDSWTMRISKAPTTISISEEAPLVQGQAGKDVLEAITAGFNSRSRVTIAASEPYTSQRTCFYVVVSKEGVSPSHALIRIFSKAGSVAVFAFGTTLFASATPMSVSITLMVLSLVLSSGVFGRVVAMWIAAEMNRYNEPVLHAVVQTRADAADHVQWLLALPGLVIEMHGHVICNGRSVHRRNEWLSRSKYIGLLAPPFDITKLASRVQPLNSVRSSSPSDGSQKASSFEQSLGLPRSGSPPQLPRRQRGLPEKRSIRDVRKVIAVSSAKGGVGKSTIAVNLALAFARCGLRSGILDTDIFGPSIPTLLNLSGEPRLSQNNLLLPLSNYGIKSMSMGYLVAEEAPVVWRGLMVMKAIQQLLHDVDWGGLDVLVMDLPPGTGDTQLTITQQIKLDGAVIVSTPQDIALKDAVKGIQMFRKVDVPILGMIQNMSVFACPHCHQTTHIFGAEGVRQACAKHGLNFLGDIPLHGSICDDADRGKPTVVAEPDSERATIFMGIAEALAKTLGT